MYIAEKPSLYASTPIATRGFCPHCGTTLTFQFNDQPDIIDIAIATLDDPDAVQPADHIWTESQLGWVKLADGLPQYRHSRKS